MTLTTSDESQIDSEAARSQTEKTLDQSFLWGTRILALAVAAVLLLGHKGHLSGTVGDAPAVLIMVQLEETPTIEQSCRFN